MNTDGLCSEYKAGRRHSSRPRLLCVIKQGRVGDKQNNNNNIDRVELCWGWMARHRQGDRRGVVEPSSHRLVSMAPVSMQLYSLVGSWLIHPTQGVDKNKVPQREFQLKQSIIARHAMMLF